MTMQAIRKPINGRLLAETILPHLPSLSQKPRLQSADAGASLTYRQKRFLPFKLTSLPLGRSCERGWIAGAVMCAVREWVRDWRLVAPYDGDAGAGSCAKILAYTASAAGPSRAAICRYASRR